MNNPLKFATELAIKTGSLLQKYFNPAGTLASQKPDQSVVTDADLAAETMITTAIQMKYPHDGIISEETSHNLEDSHSTVWVIDPLDGTTNFSMGLSIWGTSIACLADGIPQLGVLYFPMINELYTTWRDSGAYLNKNQITTRAPDPTQPMSFFACCSRSFRNYDIEIPYKPRIFGSAAYSLCMVARGSALLGLDTTPKVWDLAAAWLLVEEAGGKIASLEGAQPFPIATKIDYSKITYPTLAAATSEVYDFGLKKIHKK